jgi:hypothetical protein
MADPQIVGSEAPTASFQRAKFEHYMFGVELKRGGWNPVDTAEIERLGSIGFELVAVLPMANGLLLFFKRRVA